MKEWIDAVFNPLSESQESMLIIGSNLRPIRNY